MSEIKFARDYGYPPASPFWLVWNASGFAPKFRHPSMDAAQAEAARLAALSPGVDFHVLAVMATISTSTEVIGTRFDPTRIAPVEVAEPEAAPAFIDAAPVDEDDGRPF